MSHDLTVDIFDMRASGVCSCGWTSDPDDSFPTDIDRAWREHVDIDRADLDSIYHDKYSPEPGE